MPKPSPVSDADVQEALARAPGWSFADDGALASRRTFPSAAAAIGFVAAVGAVAERLGHHPELGWTYREVTLRLRTHDAGDRVTTKDLELMEAIVALG